MTVCDDKSERIAGTAVLFIVLICIYCVPPEFLTLEICPFKLISGVPCPLCGISRSIYHTAHGNFSLAFSLHPGGIFLFFTLISAFPVLLSSPLYTRFRKYNAGTGFLRYSALVLGTAIVLFGILRIIPSLY